MDVLQLDVSGRPQAWITPREAAVIYASDNMAWTLGRAFRVLRGGIQLARNVAFSVLKLVALPLLLLPLFAGQRLGEAIYGLWAATILISMALVLPRLKRKRHVRAS